MSTAKTKSAKAVPEGVARLYRPGDLERGLKILAKARDEADAKKDAPAAPEVTSRDEYDRLLVEKIYADARLEVATEKKQAVADKALADAEKAEQDKKWQANQAFAQAYHALLAANAGLKEPDITDEEQPERWRVQSEAERRLFSTPAANGEQVWDKLTAFEQILGEELTIGLRNESILLLAVGSIKQDVINLGLLEARS
jgi:hypothetical protein